MLREARPKNIGTHPNNGIYSILEVKVLEINVEGSIDFVIDKPRQTNNNKNKQ